MPVDWVRFAEKIAPHRRLLLMSHVRPDCDALGSELGMAGVLEALGKQVLIVNAQPTPPNLAFIDPERKIKALGVDIDAAAAGQVDLMLVLDTSAWVQLGDMAAVLRDSAADKAVIDHHVSSDDLGAEMFKDVTAEATGRLVVDAAEHLQVKLTPAIARPLFAALATDTGWFRFPSTTGLTMRTAGKLVDAGAVPSEIFNALYERDTLARLRLRGRTLDHVQDELDGRLIHTYVLLEDFEQTGALPSDTEDLVNLTLQVAGTEVAVILVEQTGGGFKVSFRSRSQVDCSQLAARFGGGGHKAAAGAMVDGQLREAQSQVLDAVRAAMR